MSNNNLNLLIKEINSWDNSTTINYSKEKNFFGVNDFELMLKDSSLRSCHHKERYYKFNFEQLNWFQFQNPNLYFKSLSTFLNYLTYYLVQKIIKDNEYTLYDVEKYFTEQVVAYLSRYETINVSDKITEVYKYWQNTRNFIDKFIDISKKYHNHVFNSNVFFTCNSDHFKINIPLIAWNKNDNKQVHCYLFNTYYDKKPNWFTIPSLYKIYFYYANHDISLTKVHLIRFNLSDVIVKPITETIPLTPNVAEMVSRYKNLSPYPYLNIFDNSKDLFYNPTPLTTLLNNN